MCFFIAVISYTQDTLFIRNEFSSNPNIESVKIDSMFIYINGKRLEFNRFDNSTTTDRYSSNYEMRFYLILNDNIINENSNYSFELQLDNNIFEFELPSNYVVKGLGFSSNLFIKTYKARRRFRFWRQNAFGYSFGTYTSITGDLIPIKKKSTTKDNVTN